MSETKYPTIANNNPAESREAALATTTPSTQPPTPSDIDATSPPTASDINSASAGVPGQNDNNQHDQPQVPPLELKSSAGTSDSGEKRTANSAERPANPESDDGASHAVKLCRHIKEDGVFCEVPALTGRQYCYRHLRLRGQQMRIARAIAQRQKFHLVLPPLEDLNAVQTALIHVTAALAAGLLERRHAGQLLYALQQAASNLRYSDRAQTQAATNASTMGAPR